MLKRITRIINLIILLAVIPFSGLVGQETNSSIGGVIRGANNQALVGATVTATHVPTGTTYRAITRTEGQYDINNMQPGGPYTIVVSYVGFNNETKNDVFLNLGEKARHDFGLADNAGNLSEVVVSARRAGNQGRGTETNISRNMVQTIPTVNRSLNDYIRVTPQAKVTGDGGISIAGQNNRYNAFYIDGAINNDVFGLAASGTNGGQANINPISIDAIDQFQVVVSAYDASIGGFTGGGINATTRSGTNEYQGSAWVFYRNENLAGKTPGNVPKEARTKLADLRNLTTGFRLGGPIVRNKLFFFVLGELERNERPQPFTFSQYRGNATQSDINNLVTYLQNTYSYDPGTFLDNPESVDANRITAKFDWNASDKHKASFSYRYNDGVRFNTSASSGGTINFYNNGYIFPNVTHTFTGELRSNLGRGMSNRLLVTYSDVEDNRDPIGKAFPRVTINDGSGSIVFGTENFSTGNLLTQKNLTFNDVFRFTLGKHLLSIGTDNLYSKAYNVFIRDLYGTYTYASLNDFLTNAKPSRYDRSFSLLDSKDEATTQSAAAFRYLNLAFFVNDEFRVTDRLTLSGGVRFDKTEFLDDPISDPFFNDSALPKISAYYNMYGARSGQISRVPWSVSPRVGFTYRMPEENITVRGGLGMFTGRMPLVWPGGVYNQNGVSIATLGVNNPNITFRADPFNQYGPQDFSLDLSNSKGQIDLISEEFKLPKLFRTSLGIDKRFGRNWTLTLEGLYSKNINEIYYQNVNIIPPTLKSVGPDSRNVYSFGGTPTRIPIRANGVNPYGGEVFLLYNNPNDKGFSYNFTASLTKGFSRGFELSASYTYGNSVVTNEGTSSQNNSQWRFMETVNGRNYLPLSTSDFDLGHRFFAYGSKKFTYGGGKFATTVSLVLNSQQGQAFSYVYSASPVGDRARGETNDLIYIPTSADLQNMTFLNNTINGVTYTPAQQKQLLEDYIQGRRYLRNHRGQFAERNGDRLPWSTILDLRLLQDFNVKVGERSYTVQLSYDVYNFTNMLSRNWGQTYFMTNDSYRLIQFAGFVSASNLTPQYRFNPQTGTPWNVSTSTQPGLSARWISQLGLRVNF
jgi:outer membrane receptor for ferrienterochelin and colicin